MYSPDDNSIQQWLEEINNTMQRNAVLILEELQAINSKFEEIKNEVARRHG